MGATTWTYPSKSVTLDELMLMLTALRLGFRDSYEAYLQKVGGFAQPPEIGVQWPAMVFIYPLRMCSWPKPIDAHLLLQSKSCFRREN